MVRISKTGLPFAAAFLWALVGGDAHATPPGPGRAQRLQPQVRTVESPTQDQHFRMVVIPGKDVSGKIYKKLGLPALQYCWDTCVREQECTGARWGVIRGDVAGLCLLLSGELSVKDLTRPKTEDGKAIQVTAARKQALASKDGGT
jgi:hypothetical protein